jgi:arylsulfatase A-like enzyme
MKADKPPNVVFVLADQWRGQAVGYAGNPNVRTPNLDRLADESVNFTNAVSNSPVCSPARASLITGRYPLSHGVFVNDVYLNNDAVSIAQAFGRAGYDTAYIGKWHLDGHGRSAFIARERRQGFDFWRALECTHNYNKSYYYADENVKLKWPGYDAVAQTREACRYIRQHAEDRPFLLFLSWGPPHNPYQTAPAEYRAMYDPDSLALRPNVPPSHAAAARTDLAGYYAHISALDACMGEVLEALRACRVQDNTLLVFTSDHGDMLGSQGEQRKQKPWEESIMVPLLLRYPQRLGRTGRQISSIINTPDIMPTLLGLCDMEVPATVEGTSHADLVSGNAQPPDDGALITCPHPFGEWNTPNKGGREYRGIRTQRYTYARDLSGPWLLYDNKSDPYQLTNLCNKPDYAQMQQELDTALTQKLAATKDDFLPGQHYLDQWGYKVDETGTVPYTL